MTHHYSEPYKEKSRWYVEKINTESKKTIIKHEFSSALLANAFLNEVNIFIDGQLMYSGL